MDESFLDWLEDHGWDLFAARYIVSVQTRLMGPIDMTVHADNFPPYIHTHPDPLYAVSVLAFPASPVIDTTIQIFCTHTYAMPY